MVSAAVDGTINHGSRPLIITRETNWAPTPPPWTLQISTMELLLTCWMAARPLTVLSTLSISFLSEWQPQRCVCASVWEMSYEEEVKRESSNGFCSLVWAPRPIPDPVSCENVSHDVERQEQVYDIISVLPQQRYGAGSPNVRIHLHGPKAVQTIL